MGWLGSLLPSELGLRLTLPTDNWQEWTDLPWTTPESHPSAACPEQIALLQYTSGSTSDPRGVMVTHRNLWYQLESVRMGDSEDSVGVSWLPLYHDLGLIGGVLTPIYYGRRTVLMSPLAFVQHPLRWLLAISRYRATTTGAPNFALDLCVSKFSPQDAEGLDLSSLLYIMTGAEPVRADSLERFTRTFAPYGLRPDVWRPCYGLAEATLGVTSVRLGSQVTWHDFSLRALEQNRAEPVTCVGHDDPVEAARRKPSGEEPDVAVEADGLLSPRIASGSTASTATVAEALPTRRLVGCGFPIPDSEVILVDPLRCTEVPERSIGEVWVHSPNVAQGYWNRPEETEAIFRARLADRSGLPDTADLPFLRTGDLGFFYEGQLYLTGRLKEVMVFWGRNVYPQDVEMTTWSAHPLLKENACAAFAVESEGQEQLVVVQEVARPRTLDLEAVAESIRQAIHAEHQVPLFALVLIKAGTLPKTSSGKIQRHAARDSFLNNELEVLQQWRYPTLLPAIAASEGRELPGPESIRGWLVNRIARLRDIPEEQIDLEAPLTQYVLDSVTAVAIAMDLQQWLGRSLSPTLLYDTPSITVLADRLAHLPAHANGNLPSSASVDQMSPDEIDQTLAQLLADLPIAELQAGPATPPSSPLPEAGRGS